MVERYLSDRNLQMRTRTMDMPNSVKAYFDADRGNDPNVLGNVFSADAVVEDEGARHEGISAIRAWWVAAKEKFSHVAEPIETTAMGDTVSVRAKVTGQFPNSPVTLEFSFITKDDKIVALRIR